MADPERYIKYKIKENFTIYRPADPKQRLENTASDVERNEEKALQQKARVCLCLCEQSGCEQQKDIGCERHQPVKRKDSDEPLGKKVIGAFLRGKKDHESADAEKNVNTEGSAV